MIYNINKDVIATTQGNACEDEHTDGNSDEYETMFPLLEARLKARKPNTENEAEPITTRVIEDEFHVYRGEKLKFIGEQKKDPSYALVIGVATLIASLN